MPRKARLFTPATLLLLAVGAALVLLAGCTTHDTGGALEVPRHPNGSTRATTAAARGSGPGQPCQQAERPGTKGEPVVPMPPAAPADLSISDLAVGTGAEATIGSVITVQYVGVSCSTGRRFDSTWERKQPYTVTLSSSANLIPGWLGGLPDMKAGGRRLLVVPPDQGYGDDPPAGSGIAPGETLVYVVDLLAVR
jgi:peptidylprolyl isomerase